MKKISAIIIAKNEELMIGDSLDSVSFCDEVIVVDNGSEDKTIEIAKKKNAIVFTYNSNDFSESRNFGLSKATGEWILYVDADERVSKTLQGQIAKTISQDTDYVGFKLKRKNFYFRDYEWPYIEKVERLFLKEKLTHWSGKLHESPIVNGNISELDGFLLHYTHRTLEEMLQKTIDWSKIEAELRFNTNHPKMTWWRFFRVMLSGFYTSYISQGGWKIGVPGLIESIYQSFSMFITYARLWELQKKHNDK